MNDCMMRNYCAGRERYLYVDAAMSEIDDRRLHVSKERSGVDRKGTIPVDSMLQGCGAGVPNVGDMGLSCLFHGVAGRAANNTFSVMVPDRRRHSSQPKHEGGEKLCRRAVQTYVIARVLWPVSDFDVCKRGVGSIALRQFIRVSN